MERRAGCPALPPAPRALHLPRLRRSAPPAAARVLEIFFDPAAVQIGCSCNRLGPGPPKRTHGVFSLYKKIAFTTRSRDGKAVAAASGRNRSAGVVGPRSEACAAPNPCTQVTLCCTAESAYRSAACMLPIKGGGRRRGARSTTASASRRARAEEGLSSSSEAQTGAGFRSGMPLHGWRLAA